MKIQALLIVVICVLSAFFCFNFVQTQEKRDRATQAGAPIEQIWDQADYEAWKKAKTEQWERSYITALTNKYNNLIAIIELSGLEWVRQLWYSKNQLYAYNLLRELLGKPIPQLSIDQNWIKLLQKDIKTIKIIEKERELREEKGLIFPKLSLPNLSQQELVQEARVITNLLDERVILSRLSGAACDKDYIAVTETTDLDEMLFGIYHELGHIKNGEGESIGPRFATFDGERFKEGQVIDNFGQDQPKTSAFLKQIENFIKTAQTRLDNSSETGRIIKKSFANTPTFWISPTDPELFTIYSVGRARESRADLFAIEELLKQKRSDSIFAIIRRYGTSDNVVAQGDVHPSDVERALYVAGFLFSKGIDVNKKLKHWENYGKCTDVRKLYGPWSRLHEKELGDFIRTYKSKEKELRDLDYKLWKNERHVSPSRQKNLIFDLSKYFNELRENPENRFFQKIALFTYNYLREVNREPMIESIDQIDKKWLKQIQKQYN